MHVRFKPYQWDTKTCSHSHSNAACYFEGLQRIAILFIGGGTKRVVKGCHREKIHKAMCLGL